MVPSPQPVGRPYFRSVFSFLSLRGTRKAFFSDQNPRTFFAVAYPFLQFALKRKQFVWTSLASYFPYRGLLMGDIWRITLRKDTNLPSFMSLGLSLTVSFTFPWLFFTNIHRGVDPVSAFRLNSTPLNPKPSPTTPTEGAAVVDRINQNSALIPFRLSFRQAKWLRQVQRPSPW